MKVKIIKAGLPTYWYSKKVGQTFEVEDVVNTPDYKLAIDYIYRIAKDDCVVISLQEELETAKICVAEIEKQLAEEAAIEAAKPFTKEQYEKVVAEYRACAGRKKFEKGSPNFVLEVGTNGKVFYESWRNTMSVAPFGVFFYSGEAIETAIEKVGAENLRKAWEYEMSIGLSDA